MQELRRLQSLRSGRRAPSLLYPEPQALGKLREHGKRHEPRITTHYHALTPASNARPSVFAPTPLAAHNSCNTIVHTTCEERKVRANVRGLTRGMSVRQASTLPLLVSARRFDSCLTSNQHILLGAQCAAGRGQRARQMPKRALVRLFWLQSLKPSREKCTGTAQLRILAFLAAFI